MPQSIFVGSGSEQIAQAEINIAALQSDVVSVKGLPFLTWQATPILNNDKRLAAGANISLTTFPNRLEVSTP